MTPKMNAEEVATLLSDKLGHRPPQREGRDWVTHCPHHRDSNPSLAVCDGDHTVTFFCRAGCSQAEIKQGLKSLGINIYAPDGNDTIQRRPYQPKPKKQRTWIPQPVFPANMQSLISNVLHPKRRIKPSTVWPYHNARGQVVSFACRFDYSDKDGSPAKDVITFTYARNRYNNKHEIRACHFEQNRPLYNLHKILANPTKPVLVSEGEKASEYAKKLFLNWTPTTASNGVNSFHKTDWSPLQNRTIIHFGDYDWSGLRYTARLADYLLTEHGIKDQFLINIPTDYSVQNGSIVEQPFTYAKGDDAADLYNAGWTHHLLKELAKTHGHQLIVPLVPCTKTISPTST